MRILIWRLTTLKTASSAHIISIGAHLILLLAVHTHFWRVYSLRASGATHTVLALHFAALVPRVVLVSRCTV